jgi:hypothetical protein
MTPAWQRQRRGAALAWCLAMGAYFLGAGFGEGRTIAGPFAAATALLVALAVFLGWRAARASLGRPASALVAGSALVPCLPIFPVILWRMKKPSL